MKKLILTLFLAASLCFAGTTAELSAAQPAPDSRAALSESEATAAESEPAVAEIFEDLSGEVIQEGGFLSGNSFAREQARMSAQADGTAALSDKEAQLQTLLLAAWDSFADTCDLTSMQITPDELHAAYAETLNYHPKYFYVSGAYSYVTSGNFVSNVIIGYSMEDKAAAKTMRDAYDKTVSGIIGKADKSWSDLEKALYINDYLARNCEYDMTLSKHTAYDALVNGTAVCQGYALAFLDLAHELGLSCEIVSSKSLNHAWDMVKIGNSYYNVDVTWNDPVNDMLGRARHQFFLKSTAYFQSESGGHAGSDWILTGGKPESIASETKYDGYFWNLSDTGFDYLNGSWYGFDGEDSICQYACNGTDFTSVKSLVTINDIWNVIGNESSFWQGKYVGTGSFDGKYYYSGKWDITEWNPVTGESSVVFSLPEDQKKTGHIYGINVSGSGQLKYLHSPSPNEAGTVYLAKSFAPTQADLSDFQVVLANQEALVYDGTEKCPEIIVKNGSVVLPPSEYKVAYSQNVHAGTAVVTVTGKGNYTGTATGTFQIQKADNNIIIVQTEFYRLTKASAQSLKLPNITVRQGPIKYQSNNKNVTVSQNGTAKIGKNFAGKAVITVTAGNSDYKTVSEKITLTFVKLANTKVSEAKNLPGKKLSIKWKKVPKASGYQIQYATNSKMSGAKYIKVNGSSKTKKTIAGLKKGKTYYVKIRTYRNIGGVGLYNGWSSAKKVRISK